MTAIVLEGPDGSGKTTLAKALVRHLPTAQVVHHGSPAVDVPIVAQYARDLEKYHPGRGHHLIFDRLHLGETIYGPLLRGESRLSDEQLKWFSMLLSSRGAVVALVLPPLDLCLERFDARGDDLIKRQQLESIWNAYDQLSQTDAVHITFKDYPSVRTLLTWAEFFEQSVAALADFPRYGGPPTPDVLFVGDTPGTPRGGVDPLTPFVPFQGFCGETLFQAIDKAHLFNYGMTNSAGINLRGLWNALYGPKTVALGNLASERLEIAGVPHTKVQHPQYVRRFRSRGTALYSIQIEEAVTGQRSWAREYLKQPGDC